MKKKIAMKSFWFVAFLWTGAILNNFTRFIDLFEDWDLIIFGNCSENSSLFLRRMVGNVRGIPNLATCPWTTEPINYSKSPPRHSFGLMHRRSLSQRSPARKPQQRYSIFNSNLVPVGCVPFGLKCAKALGTRLSFTIRFTVRIRTT